MSSWIRCMLAVVMVSIALPAAASENRGTERGTETTVPTTSMQTTTVPLPSWAVERPVTSPALKAVLFGSHAAVQALDLYSTVLAKRNGAREMNAIMDGGTARMFGVKAATSVATYFAVRSMAKKSRKGAIVTMLVLNGVTAAVAANNLKNARQ
jgi:hypothetical protein